MTWLPSDLHIRCHTILMKCSEFDTHDSLKAVFAIGELAIYQGRLNEVTSKEARVSQTMSFLLEQLLSGGRPVFPVFLATLRDKYKSGDARRDELEGLLAEVGQTMSQARIAVPFVVAAMTRTQATDLFTEAIFNDPTVAPIERERFHQFTTALQSHGIVDLLPHYGEHPEDWQPCTCEGKAIEDIISEMITHINQGRSETPGVQLIQPQLLSKDFFGQDRTIRVQAWNKLKQTGGVLVIDAVSLFHPGLRQKLSQSEISSNDRVAMLVLSPVNSSANQVNRLIEEVIDSQMELAFSRYDEHLDWLCEIGVGDLRAIQRWLYAILPEEANIVQDQKPNPKNRRIVRERMNKKPLGMERVILGQRGMQ